MEPKVVLVLDANQRSALAATRAIGCHTQYTVITADASNKALAGHSKYSSDYITYPDPAVSIEPFIAWLVQAIKKFNIDFLMPVTEITSRTILENKHALPTCHLPFAQYKTVLNISNKSALTKRAAALGVPTPFSEHFTSTADVDLSSVIYPVVVKPSLSRIKVDDQWLNTTVTVARNEAELRQIFLEHDYLERQSFMLQEFIDGFGAGLFCYYHKGHPIAFFAHRRIREKPPSGGVSVLSESISVREDMKRYATMILDDAKWHGVAMVEFRVDAKNTPHLMEINTRLWGSLQLSVDSGVNFPMLLLEGELNEHLSAVNSFKTGQQLRWFLGDVDNLYLQLKDRNKNTSEKLQAVLQFLTPRMSNRKHEVNRLGDLGPAWYELKQYFK